MYVFTPKPHEMPPHTFAALLAAALAGRVLEMTLLLCQAILQENDELACITLDTTTVACVEPSTAWCYGSRDRCGHVASTYCRRRLCYIRVPSKYHSPHAYQ